MVGFAPVNSQPKAELVSAGNGHSPLFSMNTQKMELPSLLLQVRDSQLFPGPGWGQEDGEAPSWWGTGFNENKVQRVLKSLVLGRRN